MLDTCLDSHDVLFEHSDFWVRMLERVTSLTYPNGEGNPGPLTQQEVIDSLSGPQLRSKIAMVNLTMANVSVANRIIISAGWYGLLALLIARNISSTGRPKYIVTIDRDEHAHRAASWLLHDEFLREMAPDVYVTSELGDVCEFPPCSPLETPKTILAINPSAEHFDTSSFKRYVGNYSPGTRFIVSSTNMPAKDHVSCVNSSQQLADWLNELGIQHTKCFHLHLGYRDWQRFYVTGVLQQ
jgi:hypothetical protein